MQVEQRLQPLQMAAPPPALDFVGSNGMPASRSFLSDKAADRGLAGLPETSLALSVQCASSLVWVCCVAVTLGYSFVRPLVSRLAHSLTATQVLEGEEAFLRALHPGGAGAVGKAGGGATGGAYAEEERRLVRAAAKNVKKKLVLFRVSCCLGCDCLALCLAVSMRARIPRITCTYPHTGQEETRAHRRGRSGVTREER